MPDAPVFEVPDSALLAAERALARGLCPECFGRLFGRLGHGLTNPGRAQRVAGRLGRPLPVRTTPCAVCAGLFDRAPVWVERIVRAAEGYEWHRFTCGSRWDPELLAREEALWLEVGTEWGESVRAAFNRELGKMVEARTGAVGGSDGADLVFVADLPVGRVELTVQPLYVQGRYRKLDRTLPQTRWPCRRCRGRGCDTCHGTGKTYPTSVEELIGGPLVAAALAEGTRFHGMGREDIDARMLGDGRPFVLELLRPHRRALDLAALGPAIATASEGRVEVLDLGPAEAADVVRVKEAGPEKSYRVGVLGEVPVAKVNEALELAVGQAIAQRTPRRVAHRRSDRVRTRRIVAARLVESDGGRFTLELRTEAGTYVKEWVEGDDGRTQPSLAGLVGVPLRVDFLDVIAVHDREGA
ncbi:MAG TPA: tRNA pseudouridine(54/55) synthase Pus10 [Thermoplasmata archaeon]|nr:tRNA pseudouridine(54/55) synthase Pus10 [Thermoplasmata archaeon]